MRLILNNILILSLVVLPVMAVLSVNHIAYGQTQSSQNEEVQKLLQQAKQQTQRGEPQKAIETLQKALRIAQQLQGKKAEVEALLGIGFNLRIIGQPQQALVYYTQALLISQKVGDRVDEATALTNIGVVYNSIGQSQQALGYYAQGLPIGKRVGNRAGEAGTLNNIGLIYRDIGQPKKALEYYNQALSIFKAGGYQDAEATTLSNIGVVYGDIGQPQKALEYYNQALPIFKAAGDRSGETATLNGIGLVYRTIGQPQKALVYFNQALPISQAVNDRASEAATLNNIGSAYRYIGQLQKALAYFNQALLIRQAVGNRAGEATTLSSIGLVYSDMRQPQKAVEYFAKALPILRSVGDRAGEARTLTNIGKIYHDIGQPQKALEYFNQALPIRRAVGDRAGEATTLASLGVVYGNIGQPQKALNYYTQALLIFQAVGDQAGEATTLANLGVVYRDTNRSTEAVANLEKAVNLTLKTRSGLNRSDRQQFLQAKGLAAVALSSLLIDRGAADQAYQWINRSATAELADYARLLNAKVTNPEAQIAIAQWNQQNQILQLLRQRLQEEKFSENLAQQIRTLEAQVNQQAETLARQFPETAELFETTLADIVQLKNSIPSGTTVIHPVLLTGVSNVPNEIAFFILTTDQLSVIKKSIDPVAFNALLTTTTQQLNNRFDDQYLDNLAKLYELLIRPIEAQIQATNSKQLSIIATGKLRYLPFEALYDSKTDQYLIQKYPVSYLTRLSTRSLAAKPNATTAKRILAFGNPVPKAPLALPGAEVEVQRITQILPDSAAFIGEQATLDTFKLQSLRFSLLHLATHGCFQKGGCPKLGLEENTILFADQRFNIADAALLGLQNTDLITLSACQTALETNSNGEEIAGLAYLFERAGAKATIASLWSAEDTTTQAIMVQFYENLKQGRSKGEALRQAKLNQIDSHPFFWAPFVLIGDAR